MTLRPQEARSAAKVQPFFTGVTPPHPSGTGPVDPEAEIARLKDVIFACIPWVAASGRGMAQEALAAACEAVGSDPFDWTSHPDVLLKRRPDLERRGHDHHA